MAAPSRENEPFAQQLAAASQRVLESGNFILGGEVDAFESAATTFGGASHAVSCSSGSDAQLISLMALGIDPGDEVIVPAFSFFATVEYILRVRGTPRFVDVDPRIYTLDVRQVEAACTVNNRAIVPVHLFGRTWAMSEIREIARRTSP